jgi:hypothetical protein
MGRGRKLENQGSEVNGPVVNDCRHFVPVNSQALFARPAIYSMHGLDITHRSVERDSVEWHAINPQLPLLGCLPGISQLSAHRYAVLSDPWSPAYFGYL